MHLKDAYIFSLKSLLLLALLAFFSWLMLLITLQYIPINPDVAFLRTKQNVAYNKLYQVVFYSHVYTSMIALAAGFTQFSSWLLKHYSILHRSIGKAYIIVVVFISGPSGFAMGVVANGGLFARLSFGLLSIGWIWFTWKAYWEIKSGHIMAHQKWMYRSYALTLSAVSLRLWKVLIVFAFEPGPMDVYRVVAWLGWLGNLFIAEWIIRRRFTNKPVE